MYLAKEGDIPAGSPAWLGMSEHDRWGGRVGTRVEGGVLRALCVPVVCS